jgi:hypothetical protein
MKQQPRILLLLCVLFACHAVVAQKGPSNDEILRLVIEQKKATDSKDAMPFTLAAGRSPKAYVGHYTSLYNNECLVICPLQQGRDFIQFVLLLYQTRQGYWQNGCWYFDNAERVKVKDFNKDSVLEVILETKINSGNRAFGNYKIISLLNLNQKIWYENKTELGIDHKSLMQAQKGKEVTMDVKVTIVDTIKSEPAILKERTIIGRFNSYSDSLGANLDYETKYRVYIFRENKYIPKLD